MGVKVGALHSILHLEELSPIDSARLLLLLLVIVYLEAKFAATAATFLLLKNGSFWREITNDTILVLFFGVGHYDLAHF